MTTETQACIDDLKQASELLSQHTTPNGFGGRCAALNSTAVDKISQALFLSGHQMKWLDTWMRDVMKSLNDGDVEKAKMVLWRTLNEERETTYDKVKHDIDTYGEAA